MTTVNTTTTSSTATSQLAGLTTDYTMFLKLLTTQMQNQDPLDPLDTSEYTQQLVQYSQVEQAIQQSASLQDIVSQLNAQQMSQASSFIGKEARFDSAVAGLGADPATWTYYVDGTPGSITATIADSSGKVVNTVTLDPDVQGRFEWDGMKSDGSKAADGAYTLSLTAATAGGDKLDATINSVAKVTDVVSSGADIMLGVNGIRMPLYGLVGVSAID
ncbi:flagellar hook assembly protein FlgD [Sphingobium sp.]|uniref:flagellar hook assembly protein FlgD n=1 Tax=Sphingobium sp. TaxID=1912891 RepID=UPI002C2E8F59|nr:flagellar hook capping FlgD N-terminal domain-containing protein [Sphingobium sp.]HUD91819.1 flagellar hook capping FlgD N-terminal domain-containing protein [Sphingobium sp.]